MGMDQREKRAKFMSSAVIEEDGIFSLAEIAEIQSLRGEEYRRMISRSNQSCCAFCGYEQINPQKVNPAGFPEFFFVVCCESCRDADE
jgi:hypothetical protein